MVAHTGFLVVARRIADTVRAGSELTPWNPFGTEKLDANRTAGSMHDDEGGDPPEDLESD